MRYVFSLIHKLSFLSCIQNSEQNFPTSAMHRLNEIGKSIETEKWNYIPGKFNIADMCTQASQFIDLNPQSTGVIGPAFLCEKKLPDHRLEQEVEVINALEKIDKQTY